MTLKSLTFALGMLSLPAQAHEMAGRFCHETAISEESICRVSHFQIAAHPGQFDGKLVILSSVLRKVPNGPLRLYYSNEAADYEMADDVIVVSRESVGVAKAEGLSNGLVRVYGRFHTHDPSQREEGIGEIQPILEIFNESRPSTTSKASPSDSE